jgi:predicted ribosome quality control (RQC) complex YloA/Tae2 family protein
MKKFETPAGCIILVGSNATDNDKVTFELGEPDDWWFHAQGSPGAHVVLKGPATQECMQMAADLALFYSKGYNKVDVTKCSQVRKTGTPGLVLLANWQTFTSSRRSFSEYRRPLQQ